MSEPTPDNPPADTPPAPAAAPPAAEPARIDFDRADLDEPAGERVTCGLCKRHIETEYWQIGDQVLCEGCREQVLQGTANAGAGGNFARAFLIGGGAALACGIGYALFVGLTKLQFALITIGIGWVVGRAIQRVTRGFGSRRHQVLAVALTYFGSSMGYLPAILSAFDGQSSEQAPGASVVAPAEAPPAQSPVRQDSEPPSPAAGAPPVEQEAPGALAFVLFLVFTFFLVLIAPILDITSGFGGILGALIIFFGLQTAWRASRGVQVVMTGPYQVGGAPPP